MLEQLLPAFIGKCLLGLAFSLIPVLVLLNMRRRQRQVNEGRRRYQDIFDGTGVALCVLDLSGLRGFFDKAQLHTREQLQEWLHNSPEQRQQLLKELRITEVNQVAVRLLNVASCEQAWERLIDGCPLNTSAIGYAVLEAVLTQHKQLELEIQLSDIEGNDQYLWLVMRLPEEQRTTVHPLIKIHQTLKYRVLNSLTVVGADTRDPAKSPAPVRSDDRDVIADNHHHDRDLLLGHECRIPIEVAA